MLLMFIYASFGQRTYVHNGAVECVYDFAYNRVISHLLAGHSALFFFDMLSGLFFFAAGGNGHRNGFAEKFSRQLFKARLALSVLELVHMKRAGWKKHLYTAVGADFHASMGYAGSHGRALFLNKCAKSFGACAGNRRRRGCRHAGLTG